MVAIFLRIVTLPAIGRGTFTSAEELVTAIETYIDAWNDRCALSAEPGAGWHAGTGEEGDRRRWQVVSRVCL